MNQEQGDVTVLLRQLQAGDPQAARALFTLVYKELQKIAGAKMRAERQDHTLQPTALVHEAYLRLVDQSRVEWRDRAHFFGVAAQMMRRVLVDYARSQLAAKRGGPKSTCSLEWIEVSCHPQKLEEVLVVHEAIDRLERLDQQQARVVEMHYFGGMTMQETAAALGVSVRTAHRDWSMAKSWLQRELSRGRPDA